MHVILGGRYQGKRAYAEGLYGEFPAVSDLEQSNAIVPGLVVNVHLGIRRGLREEFFLLRLGVLRECVVICEEVGGGIIPLDPAERSWRDETGKVYQLLAREADIVDRIFAGLALRLKG